MVSRVIYLDIVCRMALEEVKHDLQERLLRWHVMERLCGFPIVSNPGLAALHQTLHGGRPDTFFFF